MSWTEERIQWQAEGKSMQIGLSRFGSGPELLLLPAISSISTRNEMRDLQQQLGANFSTIAIDWPGFGTLPRPQIDWRPEHYCQFVKYIADNLVTPDATIAAGHAASYVLAQAANHPASMGKLCLLSPTWRGPLPTMTSRQSTLFGKISKAVDLPFIGSGFYRLNVNAPVISMMARGHVYADPAWLTAQRLAEKRLVTEAAGARYASFRFVTGVLDLFTERQHFLDTAQRITSPILLAYGKQAPLKSKAEMIALSELPGVTCVELPQGKLSFYEEFAGDTASIIHDFLRRDG